MICVSIGRTRHKMVALEHRALAEKGAQLVEYRLDWLSHMPDVGRLLKHAPTPVVATCRRQSDKGRWRHSEEQRLNILRQAIAAGVDYVDLEDDVAQKIPRYGSTKRIVSHHNFDETPEHLQEIHDRLAACDPDYVKLVTMANSPRDTIRMLKLVEEAQVPTIGFCMGELGTVSRILCGKYGAPFTYATFSRERELAPGQLSFEEMHDTYRYDSIKPTTQVFGVLGDPIAHSYSPLIHNAAFAAADVDAVYLPLRVPKDALTDTLDAYDWLDIAGYSVTIPHKEGVLAKADRSDDSVKDIGAANTLFRRKQGVWHATNTDYEAALAGIRLGLKARNESDASLAGKKILMLGAGGVARAVAMGVVRAGAALTIANRTKERAVELAGQLGCQHIGWENRASVLADVVVNCTPIGMHPHVDESPFEQNWLRDGMVVFDTVYNPENTLFIKQAREHECFTVTGIEMFVRQAAAQFEIFTGQPAPRDVMRDALRKGISALR
ncbi:MAG: shikimate dehydrogenase [Planctomycetaceae bacterium]|nr:shikimate dehydrogenase [Planctomycetaceae bacterium]